MCSEFGKNASDTNRPGNACSRMKNQICAWPILNESYAESSALTASARARKCLQTCARSCSLAALCTATKRIYQSGLSFRRARFRVGSLSPKTFFRQSYAGSSERWLAVFGVHVVESLRGGISHRLRTVSTSSGDWTGGNGFVDSSSCCAAPFFAVLSHRAAGPGFAKFVCIPLPIR